MYEQQSLVINPRKYDGSTILSWGRLLAQEPARAYVIRKSLYSNQWQVWLSLDPLSTDSDKRYV